MKVTQSYPALCDPWTVAHQAPLSMEFSRQEYWSRQLIPSLGDLPNPGIEPRSPGKPCALAQQTPSPAMFVQNIIFVLKNLPMGDMGWIPGLGGSHVLWGS